VQVFVGVLQVCRLVRIIVTPLARRQKPHEIELLFEIVQCFGRQPSASDFSFVRTYIETEVIPVSERRAVCAFSNHLELRHRMASYGVQEFRHTFQTA
jgi:hypothetical protein